MNQDRIPVTPEEDAAIEAMLASSRDVAMSTNAYHLVCQAKGCLENMPDKAAALQYLRAAISLLERP